VYADRRDQDEPSIKASTSARASRHSGIPHR
jgi:hypothetical protein